MYWLAYNSDHILLIIVFILITSWHRRCGIFLVITHKQCALLGLLGKKKELYCCWKIITWRPDASPIFPVKVLHSGYIKIVSQKKKKGYIKIGLELYRDIAASCYLELNCHTLII